MKNKNIVFYTIFYIYTTLSVIYSFTCLLCIENPINIGFFLAFLVPVILLFVLKKVSEKYIETELFATFCAVIAAIIMTVVFLIVGFLLYIDHKVPRLFYRLELNSLKKQYGEEKFSHFPDVIPFGAKNYYFHVDHAWDNSVDVLYFDIDENYINDVQSSYKKRCKAYGKKWEVFAEYSYPHLVEVNETDMLCMFNLPSGEERYLTGFLTGKNRIYFFYENW